VKGIALIDCREEVKGERVGVGVVVGIFPSIKAAFGGNAEFQRRMACGHIRTKILTLKHRLPNGAVVRERGVVVDVKSAPFHWLGIYRSRWTTIL